MNNNNFLNENNFLYSYFLNDSPELIAKELQIELEKWDLKFENNNQIFSAISLLTSCDPIIFPRVNLFLRIISTLAVSNASPERTFSALKRLKTWLRSTMSQERLTGLALLHILRERNIDPKKIIDRFADKKKRRLDFII